VESYDIAIVGSGFAGSLMAMICQRLGRSVVLLERGRHPRFTIGESSTPLTNLMLEELTTRYNLPALAPLAKWGTWQQNYPGIACGLKRGFSFFHHQLGRPEAHDSDRENQLLVAASPNDSIADTHWYRPDFDKLFANEAQQMGIRYLDQLELTHVSELEDEIHLKGVRHGQDVCLHARFVIDATGPRGFLNRTLNLGELPIPDFPHTQALYSHFTGVGRWADFQKHTSEAPPYPVDDAAVHHVFDGGWIWVLQFNNGVTSAGVAATDESAKRLNLDKGEPAWQNLLHLIPSLRQQFDHAKSIRPFTHVPRLSFRSGKSAGQRWVLLPSAAGFVDPLFSTGFALTLLGIGRLAEIIQHHWNVQDFPARVRSSASKSEEELLAAGRLIGGLYARMGEFPVFVSLSFLYFTSVIFSETVRRLGKPEMASSFLLFDHPEFGHRCQELLRRAREPLATGSSKLCEDILQVIDPLNLAGLGDSNRRNWYPADARDLFQGAYKVGASKDDIAALLRRSGFDA
jgi:tetracycline 7-halogenase / FADH2 O2-dependent halogenase